MILEHKERKLKMTGYIEQETTGEYFNPTSSTVEINPDIHPVILTNSDENIIRWKWLVQGWDTMTFKERMALFFPYMHYINLRDSKRIDFDESLNQEITEMSYKLCRDFSTVQFDPDRQGIPNILVIYKAINLDAIPDSKIRGQIIAWGKRYNFIHCSGDCTDCYWSDNY